MRIPCTSSETTKNTEETSMLWKSIWSRIWLTLNRVENRPGLPQHDASSISEEVAANTIQEPEADQTVLPAHASESVDGKKWSVTANVINEVTSRPFETPLTIIPKRRYPRYDVKGEIVEHGVYSIYGRPPKENGSKKFPKARTIVMRDLPGKWNNGNGRLYVQEGMGIHLRQALQRCEEIEEKLVSLFNEPTPVISAIHSMGAYNHRAIRHKKGNELSYHSWPIAVDINYIDNRAVTYFPRWQRRSVRAINSQRQTLWVQCDPHLADRGPVSDVLPFSKQYFQVFPNSIPYAVVMTFKSVGFAWGGDWGRSGWQNLVRKFGIKYDQEDPNINQTKEYREALNEWKSQRFYDGMHFELVMRGVYAMRVWDINEKRLTHNLNA